MFYAVSLLDAPQSTLFRRRRRQRQTLLAEQNPLRALIGDRASRRTTSHTTQARNDAPYCSAWIAGGKSNAPAGKSTLVSNVSAVMTKMTAPSCWMILCASRTPPT